MDSVLFFFRKLLALVRRRQFHSDLEDELAFHRAQTEQELFAEGVSAEEAHYAAMRQLGNPTRLKEQSHDVIAFRFETVIQDFRYALRQLRKNPGFTAIAVLILALGIGASTAIFSAVNPILFEPLPYPHAGRVVMIWEMRDDGSPLAPNFGTFRGLHEGNHSLDSLAVMKPWQPTMIGGDHPERFEGQRVSAEYFRTLGILPVLGRDFQASDDQVHGPNVVILSDRLWHRRFAGDASIVGRQVTLDDNLYTVIGVMPPSFENVLAPSAELWAPLQYDPSLPPYGREWGHHLQMVGRLLPGISREQARSEFDVVLRPWTQMYAKGYDESGGAPRDIIVNSLQSDVTKAVKPALLAVLAAVMLVLLIACVNVTNLLLARGVERRGEFAMRAALGAARGRLIRQLLTESLLLAFLGAALGMLVAEFGIRALLAVSPAELPRIGAIRMNAAVFAFAFGVTTIIGVVVGLIPSRYAFRGDLHIGLQQNSPRAAAGHQFVRRVLVVAEVALALVLLVSAGLLFRSLGRLFAIDPGFDPSHVISMQVQEYGHRFDDDRARDQFFKQALEAVRSVPGVTAAAFTSQLPLSGDSEMYGVQFDLDGKDTTDEGEGALRYAVTPGYIETMHIALRRGRLLNERDTASAHRVALINEALAQRKFPNQDPVGRRICLRCDVGPNRPWSTIVGVVADVKQASLAIGHEDAFYVPTPQWYWVDNVMSLVVRTRGDAAAMAPAIRQAIWSVDKDQPVVRVATMESLLAASETERHFALIVFEAFALVGLVLAAIGIYGVLSGSVNERTREIGIRSALGASRKDILTLVVRQGMTLTGMGLVIGFVAAMAASQALITLLFGVSRLDPVTYLGVMALLLAVSVIACWVPARRAASVDPAITLRAE